MNATYNFSISSDSEGPTYTNIVIDPNPDGYAQGNVTLQCDVSDVSGVDTIWVNVTLPDSSTVYVPMSNSSTGSAARWRGYFNETWLYGNYTVSFMGNDTNGFISNYDETLRIFGNISIDYQTVNSIYYPNQTVDLELPAFIQVYSPTNFTYYLQMHLDFLNDSASIWQLINATINRSGPWVLNVSDILDLQAEWSSAGSWYTGNYPNGTYRVYTALTSPNGTVLQNPDDSYMNFSYQFELRNETNIPAVNWIIISPQEAGYGQNVTITANLTDDGDINRSWVNITYPNGVSVEFNMTNISNDLWSYTFNDTWVWGWYDITVFAEDNDTFVDSRDDVFNVSADVTVKLETIAQIYYENDIVLLNNQSNISIARNYGTTNTSAYFLMTVEYWNNTNSSWNIINDTEYDSAYNAIFG